MELLSLMENHQTMLVMYFMAGTVLIVIVLLLLFFAQPKQMNWYERNVLDLSRTNTQRVHCKAFNRLDTEDDRDSIHETFDRKQSRIIPMTMRQEVPRGDVSGMFTIPRASRQQKSMFTNPVQSQFDKGLYQITGPDSESSYNDESIGACGSIKLSIFHDPNLGIITVCLLQAIDVPSKRQDGSPNPYFRVALELPENKETKVEHQTKVQRNTSSPNVNESFCFQSPSANISACRLEIMVYDFDQFSVDECIGYCWLTLGRINVSTDPENPTVFWAEVLPFDENGGKGFGEVLFSLTYLSRAQRLTMNVFKTRNLKPSNLDPNSAITIRVSLLNNSEKRLKRKKTSAKRNIRNAQFNESLTFSIPKSSLCDIILEVEAIHEFGTFGMGCEVLGRMELPLHRCKELWRAIIREEKSQARWYALEEP